MRIRVILSVGTFVLLLASACTGGRHELMLQQLSELERQNVADSVMTKDSLAEALVDYFDRHGSANERLRAYYILGRTYADLGEAPAAISAYLDAADCADTTAADCDFAKLSRVYGQMKDVFYWQNMMDEYVSACKQSIYYAWEAKDTVQALNEYSYLIVAYSKEHQYDTVIQMFDSFYETAARFWGKEKMGKYCTLPVLGLLEEGRTEEAKQYLDLYETYSGYFDSEGNISNGRETYYSIKGRYYAAIGRYDSAEYYFRKELDKGLDYYNQNVGARRLALLYTDLHNADSAAKYALYSYDMMDSVYKNMQTQDVERLSALFNYNKFQNEAQKERIKAESEKRRNTLLIIILLNLTLLMIYLLVRWKKKRKAAAKILEEKMLELDSLQSELAEIKVREEDYLQQIASLESAIGSQSMEPVGLLEDQLKMILCEVGRLQSQMKEREAYIEVLKSQITANNEDILMAKSEVERQLRESAIYSTLKAKLSHPKQLSLYEQMELDKLFQVTMPRFHMLVHLKENRLSASERHCCYLLRLHFSGKEISGLLGVSTSSVSQNCESALKKIFHEVGSGKILRKELDNLYE